MRAGRSVHSDVTIDSRDAQVVAYMPIDRILSGLADAFIDACRTGVLADHLPGQTTYTSGQLHLTVDTIAQRIADLRKLADEAEQSNKDALAAVLKVKVEAGESEEDADEEREYFKEAARQARADRRAALAEITALEQSVEPQRPDGPFNAFTSVIVPAMSLLKTCGGRVTQEQYHSLNLLLASLTFEERSGSWWGNAVVRVNADDGMAELGPIEWLIGAGGNGTQALRRRVNGPAKTGAASKAALKVQLTATGKVTAAAAQVLGNALFPELPQVVLHGAAGEPFPDWVGEQWRRAEFVEWITKVYTDPRFIWLGNGKYTKLSRRRQLLATFAETHPTFELSDLDRAVGIDHYGRFRDLYAPPRQDGKIRPLQPVLASTEGSGSTYRQLRGFQCACGNVAGIFARVPEIPRDLLCECLLMPDAAAYGMDPDLRFPDEYRLLRLSWDECVAEMTQSRAKRIATLGTVEHGVMTKRELLTEGVAEKQLTALILPRGGNVSIELRNLESYGFLQNDGARPAIWRYTEAGLARADELISADGN